MRPKIKILMVSMPTLHFFRWVSQLKNTNFEVYWFDIVDGGNSIEKISWVHQITNWKRKFDYPGRSFIKKNFEGIYNTIQKVNDRSTEKVFEETLKKIQPDMVHSFALYVSCTPIISVMKKYNNISWIYSSWGSDLFYFQNDELYLKDIKRVLPRVNYLFADCRRDFLIAKKLGFQGDFLGVYPGGGGFDFSLMKDLKKDFKERNVILIKGYQGRSGRAVEVLKALLRIKNEVEDFGLTIFGAAEEVVQFVENSDLHNWENLQVYKRVKHEEVLKLMGEAVLYIGNSNSDGMPNTLLEAMCMGVIPVQSNPGGVTEEVIKHAENGYLIDECENVDHIKMVLTMALRELKGKYESITLENEKLSQNWEFTHVKEEVIKKYNSVSEKI
ncbi:glycosyltransferase [Neptunitalea lumnitzerae]|uniref:Glycosyltransferase n=1 Tax=Neptunitalea lumnitzerae TaxID=2965509 RepID=A0ABQ5MN55_9FLAO|nr:glycosyltransferase [Neptunitalea sp. Y10]GLB50841.1 hypothetical protein Y10_32090 [Neptunitalea sp. Y10]